MDIGLAEYNGADNKPTSFGLNVQRKHGITYANLFAIAENQGGLISDQLWGIANYVSKDILQGERPENILWTLCAGDRRSQIRFSTINGQPLKIDISDYNACRWEEHEHDAQRLHGKPAGWVLSLDEYIQKFDGQPPLDVSKGLSMSMRLPETSRSIFTVPCANPAAKDGVFHCVPSFYDADHMRDRYEFILADTKKLIAKLRHDDPGMIDHSNRKFGKGTAHEWLESTSVEHPRDMGMWSYSDIRGFTLSSGQAAHIRLIEELNLPYVPIAMEKAIGSQKIKDIREILGYGENAKRSPNYEPVFP